MNDTAATTSRTAPSQVGLDQAVPDVVALRRRIHAHAEPGFLEYRTAATVIESLQAFGVPYRSGREAMDLSAVAVKPSHDEHQEWAELAISAGVPRDLVDFFRDEGTAVVAELSGNRPGPVWGLRMDMDALPVEEESEEIHVPHQLGFGSRTPYMHACAHDGHTAVGIALASRLADGDFPGTVRILFQPAEEGVRGARPMIAGGAVEGIDVMLALHLGGDQPVGTVIGGTVGMMGTTKWQANFTGEPAHAAAAPEAGRNALAAAAQATLGILGMTRFSTTDTRVNVGTFNAYGSANIIPAAASITYETRANENAVLEEMNRRTAALVNGAAHMYDVKVEAAVYGEAATSSPDREVVEHIGAAAEKVPGVTEFVPIQDGVRGSDDAHLMIQAVQAAGGTGSYIWVGADNPAPHHHHRFDIDEAALDVALDLLEAIFREDSEC